MEWGIDTWIFSEVPIQEALTRIKNNNIRYAEIAYEHLEKSDKNNNLEKQFDELNEALASVDIKATQIHGPFGEIDYQLGSLNESVRAGAIKRIINWIKNINKTSIEVLVLHTNLIQTDYNLNSESFLHKIKEINLINFSEVVKSAQDFGVKIAIENRLEQTFGAFPNDLIELVDEINNDYVGICLDTGHANVNGIQPSKAVRMFEERLIATHVHDNNGKEDQHLLPLLGNIKWADFIAALNDIHYNIPIIVETPGGIGDVTVGMNKIKAASIIMKEILQG
ncbi:MAG: sugar phosphate isomerase/epimerase [Thermoproteota archaeon]|nr:sugar phosphate isomerase/epimerase [Candidatus Brockarchaeota archaeon]MBO3768686.1 sugar phosphate isomerase/epimerase [Candidatus Brockarchaeota archaeon]MBO3801733.1 sugar phosphate isomerase/epimerase [Candidatus Brockarchaeota archaeon]